MKEVYLAYFDFMGFKQFILNNEDEVLVRRMEHIFRDIEMCIARGKFHPPQGGMIFADTTQSKLNTLNISDTILFWTNDLSEESLAELIEVAYEFNWREITYNFPLRGAIVKGNIRIVSGKNDNENGGSYSVQCLYGKGLVYAHELAESQDWAGTIIDEAVIYDLESFDKGRELIEKNMVNYDVPLKKDRIRSSKVFKLRQGIFNDEAQTNLLNDIERVFALDNKGIELEDVKRKIKNTQDFLIHTKEIP
ncbi:hypothetical protein [Amniculibacterium aquaticum]|uniref:hypothetical protein n=1 Tax=Amniculibacterium aquaticum TaxID=2479858 RepID=UPI000F5ADEDD|nr:hypothetical protein [Amniculibacterium aquaticum]